MDVKLQIFESVLSFALLSGLIYFLKTRNFFKETEGSTFSKLLVDIILPATIFFQLASHKISSGQLILIIIMLLSGIFTIAAAYFIAKLLKADRPATGAFMITSGFGSSALLGYPLIQMVFPNDPDAMTDAVLISEIGVGLPIFTICPVIAMWFGTGSKEGGGFSKTLVAYLRSPVFIALFLGLILSFLNIDFSGVIMNPVKSLAETLGNGIGVISCVILGIYLKPKSFKGVMLLIIFSALLEMGMQPAITAALASLFNVSDIHRKILIFISSMPAAILGPVFAARYNCASDTAATIAYSHIILALISIPLVNYLL